MAPLRNGSLYVPDVIRFLRLGVTEQIREDIHGT